MEPNQKKNNFVDQIQKLERTIYEMNRNGGPYDINLQNEQNSNSLFSKTNEPIIIPEHPHPLINCFNQVRIDASSIWICDNCGCKYKCSVPSFYCTSCDYDMCQKCIFQHPIYKINFYNYGQNEKFELNFDNTNVNYRPNIHGHIMTLIRFDHGNQNLALKEKKYCICGVELKETFYYCSICNFYLCRNCFDPLNFDVNKFNPNFKKNNSPEGYLSEDQLNNDYNYL